MNDSLRPVQKSKASWEEAVKDHVTQTPNETEG